MEVQACVCTCLAEGFDCIAGLAGVVSIGTQALAVASPLAPSSGPRGWSSPLSLVKGSWPYCQQTISSTAGWIESQPAHVTQTPAVTKQ